MEPARRGLGGERAGMRFSIGLRLLLSRWLDHILAWRRLAAERRYLATLGDYYRKDIGLPRHDAKRDPMDQLWRR